MGTAGPDGTFAAGRAIGVGGEGAVGAAAAAVRCRSCLNFAGGLVLGVCGVAADTEGVGAGAEGAICKAWGGGAGGDGGSAKFTSIVRGRRCA